MLGRHWEYGNARVVDRQVVRTGKHGSWSSTDRYHTAYEYIADVEPDSGAPPFRATFKERFYKGKYHEPQVGEHARVKFQPKDQEVEFDRSALQAPDETPAARARREQFEATARAAPGTPAAGVPTRRETPAAPLESREILAAVIRAKQAGDIAEVERLKAQMAQLADERSGKAKLSGQ